MDGIVIGVDESASAMQALRWGVDHADLHERPATVVMAWTFRDQHHLDPATPYDTAYSRREAGRDLDAIIERALDRPHPGLSRRAVCDRPADALIAASHDADLLVVGARGMGGFKGLLLGSVSREVLYGSTAPVVIVRNPLDHPDGPIVVGVDGSAVARRALSWATAEAAFRDRPLIALHVWNLGTLGEGHLFAHADASAAADTATRLLDREVSQCAAVAPPASVERRVHHGLPAASLVEASRTASLVVIGSRGQRSAAGLLLGSVSDQVTHHAACPVVVFPPSPVTDHPGARRR
jgi:nucleotide-binding universal stress UspA family protein